MKRLLLLSLGLLIFALPSRAQSSFDASVGYSYFHLGGGADLSQNGISGSIAYKPIPFLGIVGDFGGYHASPGGVSLDTYTFLFGPRIIVHNPSNITPFVQFLAGDGHVTVRFVRHALIVGVWEARRGRLPGPAGRGGGERCS